MAGTSDGAHKGWQTKHDRESTHNMRAALKALVGRKVTGAEHVLVDDEYHLQIDFEDGTRLQCFGLNAYRGSHL